MSQLAKCKALRMRPTDLGKNPVEVKMKVYEVLFLLSRTFYFPHKQDCSRLVLYDLE